MRHELLQGGNAQPDVTGGQIDVEQPLCRLRFESPAVRGLAPDLGLSAVDQATRDLGFLGIFSGVPRWSKELLVGKNRVRDHSLELLSLAAFEIEGDSFEKAERLADLIEGHLLGLRELVEQQRAVLLREWLLVARRWAVGRSTTAPVGAHRGGKDLARQVCRNGDDW